MLDFLNKVPYGSLKQRKIAFWIAVFLVAYTSLGFLVVPMVAQSIAEKEMSKALGRQTTIKGIYFNPLTFRLEVDGLNVKSRDGSTTFFGLKRLSLAPGFSSLWEFAPVAADLTLDEPVVNLTFLGDGKYNFSDLIEADSQTQAPSPDAPVFPFALYELVVNNGHIVFQDQPHGKRHEIKNLSLQVPFMSSLEKYRKEFTQPHLSAVVNGDPLEFQGRILPFDTTLRTEFKLGAVEIDLDQYDTYIPAHLPLTLEKGTLSSEISLFFSRPEGKRIQLKVGGKGRFEDVEISAPDQGKVLGFKSFSFALNEYSLDGNSLAFTELELDTPFIKVIRDKNGTLNWQQYFPAEPIPAPEETSSDDNKPKPAAPETPQAQDQAMASEETQTVPPAETGEQERPVQDFLAKVKSLIVRNGTVEWLDNALPKPYSRTLGPIEVTAQEISTAREKPMLVSVSVGRDRERLTTQGSITLIPFSAKLTLSGTNIHLEDFASYARLGLPLPLLKGTARFKTDLVLLPDMANMTLSDSELGLEGLALAAPGETEAAVSLKSLAVQGAAMDLNARSVGVSSVTLDGPSISLERNARGIDLILPFQNSETKTKSEDSGEPWNVTVEKTALKNGTIAVTDTTLKRRNSVALKNIALTVDNLSTNGKDRTPFSLNADWPGSGSISATGKASLHDLHADGAIRLKKLALSPLDPYLDLFSELILTKGSVSAELKFSADSTKSAYSATGSFGLDDLMLKDGHGKGEFASLNHFRLKEIRFDSTGPSLHVGEISLSKPHALVAIDDKGRLNVRRLFRIPEPEEVKAPTNIEEAEAMQAEENREMAEPAPASKEEPSYFKTVDIGRLAVLNGGFSYRDQSVDPDFSLDVTEVGIYLEKVTMKDGARPKLRVSAHIGPTPISISGAFNPVVSPIFSDMHISVNGLELVPLTPYMVRHLGYPVEKGRLYADVSLKTENRLLEIDNKFFVQQLVLGRKVDGPDVPNVPVKLGLALLQDSNGDMEINLPVRGRLDDPNFRIGGIVFRTFVGLLFRAVASPFSIIGSMFGGSGSQNLEFVTFEPGLSLVGQGASLKLDTVAKAMTERPKIKLEVDGAVDPVTDRSGLVAHIFRRKLMQAKYESLSRKERAETTVDAMIIGTDEYADILYEAYSDDPAGSDEKPKTLFVVDRQPVEFMEKFMIDHIRVTEEDLQQLAVDRAKAVKQYLLDRNPELAERIFLLNRATDKPGKTGVPGHRADLGLK
ncbi:DUF748 domain-containing protein [Pseudodesulfovibrio tunisiensis]|uniref:DUF748 domain-containing protein n=1 Tax=Pseudodesulfovibrio tunisiensis TaxID=463192 RepID=UPI001FB259E0|nr:DUF748 domain-containing protein [Pseudodesulfovibrio tunisiensis]